MSLNAMSVEWKTRCHVANTILSGLELSSSCPCWKCQNVQKCVFVKKAPQYSTRKIIDKLNSKTFYWKLGSIIFKRQDSALHKKLVFAVIKGCLQPNSRYALIYSHTTLVKYAKTSHLNCMTWQLWRNYKKQDILNSSKNQNDLYFLIK